MIDDVEQTKHVGFSAFNFPNTFVNSDALVIKLINFSSLSLILFFIDVQSSFLRQIPCSHLCEVHSELLPHAGYSVEYGPPHTSPSAPAHTLQCLHICDTSSSDLQLSAVIFSHLLVS